MPVYTYFKRLIKCGHLNLYPRVMSFNTHGFILCSLEIFFKIRTKSGGLYLQDCLN
jgi:hypothetical protein